MREQDLVRLETFTEQAIDYLRTTTDSLGFDGKRKFDSMGFLVEDPENAVERPYEGQYVLHIGMRSFVLKNFLKLLEEMRRSINSNLFGLSERTLYDYTTQWVFVYTDTRVIDKHRERLTSLLIAGNLKYFEKDQRVLEKYIKRNKMNLTYKDIEYLGKNDLRGYFDRVYKIIGSNLQDEYGRSFTHSFLDSVSHDDILTFQHIRVHANPLSLNETLSDDIDRSHRHKILIAYYLRQFVDYLRHYDNTNYKKLLYYYNKYAKNVRWIG